MKADCIIVGGGLIGMLSARELKKAGMDVLLLDKGQLGHESSWAGGGILSPLHPWRYSERVNQLAQKGHRQYEQLAGELRDESGIDPEYRRSGLLVVDSLEQDEARLWASKWKMSIEFVESVERLQQIVPGLSSTFGQGIWLPEIAQMRNPRLVKSLKGSLEAIGVEYIEGQTVERLNVTNHQIRGVVANGKNYHSERVLIAGGAWSSELLAGYGPEPEIGPVKGQMILFRGEPDLLQSMILSDNRYLIPRKDGRILCGSTIEHTGFDRSTSETVKEELYESAVSLFPALAALEIENHWAGLRPGSPEGVPYIGKHGNVEGLYINAGHYRNGVILGYGSALEISAMIAGC